MAAELPGVLLESTLAATTAMLLVLGMGRLLRRRWGPRVAYLLWLCVPVAVVAVLLPDGNAAVLPLATAWLAPVQIAATDAVAGAAAGGQGWLGPLWLAGASATALSMAVRQARFHRGLGPLRRRSGRVFQCVRGGAGLPAVVGVLRPRILLPADFEQRYTTREQRLIIEHERLHVRRGDLLANALATLLRCLFWFHPLLPLALRRFRQDQELACDASVVARHPAQRRTYAEAMLKTQLYHLPLPLGCHWPLRHPIKERIEMLKHPVSPSRRAFANTVCALSLVACSGLAAWAVQPAVASPAQASAEGARPAVALEKMPPPRYPEAAAQAGVSGEVLLLVSVAADGTVTGVEVERATPEGVFEAGTVEAARQWKFSPAMENGKPVAARIRVPVTFEVDVSAPADADEGGQA